MQGTGARNEGTRATILLNRQAPENTAEHRKLPFVNVSDEASELAVEAKLFGFRVVLQKWPTYAGNSNTKLLSIERPRLAVSGQFTKGQ